MPYCSFSRFSATAVLSIIRPSVEGTIRRLRSGGSARMILDAKEVSAASRTAPAALRRAEVCRTESSVAAEVSRRLQESSYPALRRIACDEHETVLTLRGRVPSFHVKQLAQALAAGVVGVEVIANRIEVAAGPVGGAEERSHSCVSRRPR